MMNAGFAREHFSFQALTIYDIVVSDGKSSRALLPPPSIRLLFQQRCGMTYVYSLYAHYEQRNEIARGRTS